MSREPIPVQVRVLPHGEGLPLPAPQTTESAGMDLLAAVAEPLTIPPGRAMLVPTGIAVALPPGWEFQVRPRSGLALRHQITVLNTPGTIDADYRGEIGVILCNFGSEPFTIERGARIAQMVLAQYDTAQWQLVDVLPQTNRGSGGFGHTGTGRPKDAG